MSEEKKFYVYVHRYASGPKKGDVFYVGKGSGKRAWAVSRRSDYWNNIYRKFGRSVYVLGYFKEEACAFSIEVALIKFYGREKLCNLTDGGDGASGYGRSVVNNDGKLFNTASLAAEWCKENYGHGDASSIIGCCRGRYKSAFGHTWAYGFDAPVACEISSGHKRPVECSNGMVFKSCAEAARWANDGQCNSSARSLISAACSGRVMSAFGQAWWYEGEPKREYKNRVLRGVRTECGLDFNSLKAAEEFLKSRGYPKASKSNIYRSAKDGTRSYGYRWIFTS